MTVFRCIAPKWLTEESPGAQKVFEGRFTEQQVIDLNQKFYNIYYLPNYPKTLPEKGPVKGSDIDTFEWVFVDMDLKEGKYPSKDAFLEALTSVSLPPTQVTDSGNGIHVYWKVTDLDAMSYLRLQRRLMRVLNTDEAVAKICQLMRYPGTYNTKEQGNPKLCEVLYCEDNSYTCEQLDKVLPVISRDDEEYCKQHYNKTYQIEGEIKVDEQLPRKFYALLNESKEVKELYAGNQSDRSKADYRLAHILFASDFTKQEAMSVMVNCRKALERNPTHRVNYAANIVDKIWVFEETENKDLVPLSKSVKDILKKSGANKGTRFPCWDVFDATEYGFRLSHVLGLIGGAGSGKTTLALNYFYHFTRLNPEYIHVFVSLEQPEEEIADRWAKVAQGKEQLYEKVHVLSNYDEDNKYRNLSLSEIEDYIVQLEQRLKCKVGCVVIDHIGVLKKKNKEGEFQGIIDICHGLKAFAKRTNTFLVVQSQTSRQKAGIGDVELDKDAAYGTSMFEWYCDYIVTTHQPLKRVYDQNAKMTCSAFKYCKIRHKNVLKDKIKEDTVQVLMYDPETELLRRMRQDEEQTYEFLNKQATVLRNKDRKREPTRITKITWGGKDNDGATTADTQN